MLQLHVWLRLRGQLKYQDYWEIYPYQRVLTLLDIWEGPYIKSAKRNKLVITIEFDGVIEGSWRSIQEELERMDLPVTSMLMRWRELYPTEHELYLIECITNNLFTPIQAVDKVQIGRQTSPPGPRKS